LAIVVPRRSWLEISLRETGKGRKKEKGARKEGKKERRKEERGYPNSRARPPRSGDCDSAWTSSLRKRRTEVDYQVAAPTETSTPNLHRATIAHKECGWKGGDRGGLAQWEQLEKEEIKRKKEKKSGKMKEKA
jgi:hypothetical protein